VTRASALLRAGSTAPRATPDPGRRSRSVPGLALAAVVLVLGALLAVCCCVDDESTPSGGGLASAASTATPVDSHDFPAAAVGQDSALVSGPRLGPAAPADSCTTDASTVASTAAPSRGLLPGGAAPFAAASRLAAPATSTAPLHGTSAPPPASKPSLHQLCVMRT
jgi:hypothetical protein